LWCKVEAWCPGSGCGCSSDEALSLIALRLCNAEKCEDGWKVGDVNSRLDGRSSVNDGTLEFAGYKAELYTSPLISFLIFAPHLTPSPSSKTFGNMIFDLLFTATSFLSTLTSQLDAVTAREIRSRGDRHTDVHISRRKVVACPHRVSCREKKVVAAQKGRPVFLLTCQIVFYAPFSAHPVCGSKRSCIRAA
jgi:hypothetical protein